MKYRMSITLDVEAPSPEYKAAAIDYVIAKLSGLVMAGCTDVAVRGASIEAIVAIDSLPVMSLGGPAALAATLKAAE